MKILALDTSTDACSAAIWLDAECRELFEVVPRGHTDMILPMVDSLLAEAGLELGQMDALAFGRGPGAFTGVRIATGVIQGLAYARDLPVVPVSTLAALAQATARMHQCQMAIACLDARMEEVYWGAYAMRDGRMQVIELEERVCPAGQVPQLKGDAWCGVGSGWQVYGDVLAERYASQLLMQYPDVFPHAQDIAELAAFEVEAGNMVTADQALPVYLRDRVVHGQ